MNLHHHQYNCIGILAKHCDNSKLCTAENEASNFDLAELYEVETRVLNQAIKRNIDSFPEDFMFRLTKEEWEGVSSQIVMKSPSSQIVMMDLPKNRTGKYLPYGFHRTRSNYVIQCFTQS